MDPGDARKPPQPPPDRAEPYLEAAVPTPVRKLKGADVALRGAHHKRGAPLTHAFHPGWGKDEHVDHQSERAVQNTYSAQRHTRRRATAMTLIGAGVLLAACGGSSNTTGNGLNGTMSGTAMKGPVANATVTAFGVANGAKGSQLATARTDAQGHFTMQLGAYAGTVLVEMQGGSYTDEATNATMSMSGADVMTSVVPGFAAGSSMTIAVTPLTSMAQTMAQGMAGGMTDANVTAANGGVGSYFSVGDILHTTPMDPLVAGSGGAATQDQKNYGMTLAAMSQYAKTIGMPVSSGIVTAMMNAASDGVMNGTAGSTPINMSGMGGMMGGNTMMSATAGTKGLSTAMGEFVASGMNRSGVPVSEMQTLIDKLNASSGVIQ